MSSSVIATSMPKAVNCCMLAISVDGTSPTIKWPCMPTAVDGNAGCLKGLNEVDHRGRLGACTFDVVVVDL